MVSMLFDLGEVSRVVTAKFGCLNKMTETALFHQGVNRFVLFPIQLPQVWEEYKRQLQCFWTVGELDLAQDVTDWSNKLKPGEQEFIKMVLAFFAASDGIVGENLISNFCIAFEAPEVRCAYTFQAMMENIHSETYSLLIDTLIDDAAEKMRLFEAVQNYPCVAAKADWAIRWMQQPNSTLGKRLVAFACVEGIFFSCSFCAIFWLKKRNLMPGLCKSNEFISRDEGMHTSFACLLINMLQPCAQCSDCVHCSGNDICSGNGTQKECSSACRCRPEPSVIRDIVIDAVETERQFVREALKLDLLGINARLMEQYLECVADNLLQSLHCPRHYGTPNPFEWMDMISIEGKTNFFEGRVSEYRKANETGQVKSDHVDMFEPTDNY